MIEQGHEECGASMVGKQVMVPVIVLVQVKIRSNAQVKSMQGQILTGITKPCSNRRLSFTDRHKLSD